MRAIFACFPVERACGLFREPLLRELTTEALGKLMASRAEAWKENIFLLYRENGSAAPPLSSKLWICQGSERSVSIMPESVSCRSAAMQCVYVIRSLASAIDAWITAALSFDL